MCLSLKEKIILLADKYETPEFLQKDPSQFMHKFLPQNGGSVRDAEVVAFLSANLASGRRDQILSHIQIILDKIKESKKTPAQWVLDGEYEKIFDIAHICHAVENTCEQKCPICGGELQLKEGNQGGIYWECINQDYTRNPNQQYPTDGILRCQKCGAPFLFSMNHEPRWVCSSNPRHFQKMKEGDLKLEKMAALIQRATDRKRVAAYFAQKKMNKDT